jgi:HPt (histidine-containing phosphotransfer) domain-containing protein
VRTEILPESLAGSSCPEEQPAQRSSGSRCFTSRAYPRVRGGASSLDTGLDRVWGVSKNGGVPSINPKVIADLRSLQSPSSPSFLAELIDLFLKEADVHMEQLLRSAAAKDAQGFERAAHTLKGSCGNLGAQAMSRMCAELQMVGRAADWSRADAILPGLADEFREVRIELEAEKSRG